MPSTQKDYIFLENTISLCPLCLRRTDAKIIQRSNKVYMLKYCLEHGEQEEILEENAEYFLNRMQYTKPGTVSKTQTERKNYCPFDCGLCPDHEQHSCIGLIEITNECDLKCPACYANSGAGGQLPLEKIGEMLDFFLDTEFGNAEILQISGGEPTTHPELIEIIKLARTKNVKYVMLNTNGIRLAEDEDLVKELSAFNGGFEIYFQFDGFDDNIYEWLRGRKLLETKMRALANLAKYHIPVTLVSTIQKGINDQEIGKIVEYGIRSPHIRGINFQPVAYFGRMKNTHREDRITITGIIDCIEKQTGGQVGEKDFIPLPCNVDRVAITYLYKDKGEFIPLMRNLNVKNYLPIIRNTFRFDPEDFLKDLSKSIFSSCECCNFSSLLKNFKKIVPASYFLKSEKDKVQYVSENTFRISATLFLDAYNFDMKAMKKECVHVITPDMKKIPFSAYNMFYRKG